MKRLPLRLAAVLPLAVAGLTVAALLLSRRAPDSLRGAETAMRLQSSAQPRPAQSPTPPADKSNTLEANYVTGPRWSYAGYDIERAFDAKTRESSATIRKDGRVVVTHEDGGMGEDSTQAGLFPFLGGETKQLVVMQYTGGAHCCWLYRVYDLSPRLRPLYDDSDYDTNLGYELHPKDLDGDGRFEFTRAVMSFDYFHMSHAASVFPVAVFAYDERARRYLPANRKFADYVLRGLEKDVQSVEEERARVRPGGSAENESYLSAVLEVALKYVYAGREAEGLEFFEREYRLSDKDEIRADMTKALRGDPVYRSLYDVKRPGKSAK